LSADDLELQQASNAVFMGTTVVSGSARARVAATGPSTALGDVARSIADEPAPTAFEQSTRSFGLLIMRLTMALVLFVMLTNVLMHRPLLESLVGLTPELLPMVISVTLSRGAMRMARQRVIVKRLASIESHHLAVCRGNRPDIAVFCVGARLPI
jgi:Mg2+-importing ATPase